MLYKILFLPFLVTCAFAQKGEFYNEELGELLPFPESPNDQDGIAREIPGGFRYFNDPNIHLGINVFKHGVIGVGLGEVNRNRCPPNPFLILFDPGRYIAPYYIPNTDGEVKFLVQNGVEISLKQREDMANEINMAYNNSDLQENVTAGQIETAVFVTWNNMHNRNNVPRTQRNRNSFQLVIAITSPQRRAFAFFIYRVLNYDSERHLSPGNTDSPCLSRANIGVGHPSEEFNFIFSLAAFFDSRKTVSSYSNIDNFEELGRYVVRLYTERSEQVVPPTLNCGGSTPDLPVCGGVSQSGRRGPSGCVKRKRRSYDVDDYTTTSAPKDQTTGVVNPTTARPATKTLPPSPTVDPRPTCPPLKPLNPLAERVTKEFCRFREPGIYSHPVFCEYFMYCGVMGLRADVRKCPPGLNFNSLIGVCDWASNLECNLPREAVIMAHEFTMPPRQEVLHNNTCLLRGWSNLPDATSCSYYLACTNSRTIRMPCPIGLHWRVKKYEDGICDYPRNTNCKNGIRPKTYPITTTGRPKTYPNHR